MILKFLLFQLLGSLWGRQCFFPWADLVSARLWGMVTADASQREKAASPTPVLSVPRTRDAGLLGWRRLLGVGSSFPLQGGGHPPGDHPPGVSCELFYGVCTLACVLRGVRLCDSLDWSPPGSSVLGIFPGVGCHFFLQGIFSTQGSNLCLALQLDSFPLSRRGSPVFYGTWGRRGKCVPRGRAGRTGFLRDPGTKQQVRAQGQSWPDWVPAGRHREGGRGGGGQWPEGLGLSLDHPVSSAAGGSVHPPPHLLSSGDDAVPSLPAVC